MDFALILWYNARRRIFTRKGNIMIHLIDKALIFVLSLTYFLNGEITAPNIIGMLIALVISFAGQAMVPEGQGKGRKRHIKIWAEMAYCVLCIFCTDFIAFLPIITYGAVRTKDVPSLAVCGFALMAGFINIGLSAAYPLFLCLTAAFACMKTLMWQGLERQSRKSRDDSAELERIMRLRNRELEENLQYELHLNTLKERNRIAREIHDNVGHLLSRSLLQTGALSAICPKEQTALKSGLEDLKDSLNSAMNSIRESVHGIRDDSFDLKNEAEKIIMPLRAKIVTDFDFDITSEMPPKIKLCFISILKEAVNNIIRHSSGSKATVILREHPSMYQLIVNDNGKSKLPKITEGMGVSGMEERARAIGGNFRIGTENGFTVFVSVRKETV